MQIHVVDLSFGFVKKRFVNVYFVDVRKFFAEISGLIFELLRQ